MDAYDSGIHLLCIPVADIIERTDSERTWEGMGKRQMTKALAVSFLTASVLAALSVTGCGNKNETDKAESAEENAPSAAEGFLVENPKWEPIQSEEEIPEEEAGTGEETEKDGAGEGSKESGDAGVPGASLFGDAATMNNDVKGRELPIYCVETEEKKVALSFDAGWGNEDTAQLLEILKNHNLHVTFFMTGEWVTNYPDDVKAILEAGHDLGNHSENHKNMSQIPDEDKKEELMKVHDKVKELTGYEMCLFRPPYGDYDNAVIDVAKDCRYYTVQWDVDSLDWQNKGVDSVITTVTEHKNLGNGSIILCHNGAEYTAQALDTLITSLQDMGYEIVPVSELIYKDNFHMDFAGRQIKNEDA